MTYGHAHLLAGPRCSCGKPVQVTEDGKELCARCALVLAQAPPQAVASY